MIPVIGGLLISILAGLLVAFLSFKGFYIIILFEIAVAFILGFTLKSLMRLGSYTDFDKLHRLLIGMILLTYISNQYFQYLMILDAEEIDSLGFIDFLFLRIKAGLILKSLNAGWVGLIISWIVQVGLTYLIGAARLASSLTAYQLERVPVEVIDFAFFHFVKNKSEDEVRDKLSKMGWTNIKDQDEVFASIGAVQTAIQINRD